jgi:hypothetical protein
VVDKGRINDEQRGQYLEFSIEDDYVSLSVNCNFQQKILCMNVSMAMINRIFNPCHGDWTNAFCSSTG